MTGAEGLSHATAASRLVAADAYDALIQVAPTRTVGQLPPHVSPAGEEFIPLEPPPPAWPEAAGPWVVDLGRMTTISARAAELRHAIADDAIKYQVQAALCHYVASRNTRLGEQLTALFARAVTRVEAIKPLPPQAPQPGRPMRIRVWWPDGQRADLDATFEPPLPAGEAPPAPLAGPPGRR